MRIQRYISLVILALALLLTATPTFAAIRPPLGTVSSFGTLEGSKVTNIGATQVIGDVGGLP